MHASQNVWPVWTCPLTVCRQKHMHLCPFWEILSFYQSLFTLKKEDEWNDDILCLGGIRANRKISFHFKNNLQPAITTSLIKVNHRFHHGLIWNCHNVRAISFHVRISVSSLFLCLTGHLCDIMTGLKGYHKNAGIRIHCISDNKPNWLSWPFCCVLVFKHWAKG